MAGPMMAAPTAGTSEAPCCEAAAYLEKDANDQYIGSITCGSETADITVSLYKDAYDNCYWRVESYFLGVDELFAIGYGAESCELPTLSIPAEFYGCSGTIDIVRHDHDPLPKREENGRQVPYCGNCQCVCQVLCVTRLVDEVYVTDEFTWSEADLAWVFGYEQITLTHDAYDQCVLEMSGFDPVVIGCPDTITVGLDNGYETAAIQCKLCQCDNGVTTICCPARLLPSTFTVEITEDAEGCSGIVATGTMVLDDLLSGGAIPQYTWKGELAINCEGVTLLTVYLRCTLGGEFFAWWDPVVGGVGGTIDEDGVVLPNGDFGDPTSVSCDPFEVVFSGTTNALSDCGCGGGAPSVVVRFTE